MKIKWWEVKNHYMINFFIIYIIIGYPKSLIQPDYSFGATLTPTNFTQIHTTNLTENIFGVIFNYHFILLFIIGTKEEKNIMSH